MSPSNQISRMQTERPSKSQQFTRAKLKADVSSYDKPKSDPKSDEKSDAKSEAKSEGKSDFQSKSTQECVRFSRETPDYGLDKETIKNLGCVLHKFISMEMMLKTKTFGYLCNVTGPNWYSQHLMLGKIYSTLNKLFEKVAEENRKFGLCVPTTLEEFIKLSHTKKESQKNVDLDPSEMICDLVKCNEEVIKLLDADIERVAGEFQIKSTEDFLVEVLRKHKKINWMLRSTLVGEEPRDEPDPK